MINGTLKIVFAFVGMVLLVVRLSATQHPILAIILFLACLGWGLFNILSPINLARPKTAYPAEVYYSENHIQLQQVLCLTKIEFHLTESQQSQDRIIPPEVLS